MLGVIAAGVATYTLGAVVEAIGHASESVGRPVWCFFSRRTDKKERGSVKREALENAVLSHIPEKYRDAVEPFHWAKDYLVQNGKDYPYLALLAKQAFFRNASLLFVASAFAWRHYWPLALGAGLVAACSYQRSREYHWHLSRTMLTHYLVAMEHGATSSARGTGES